MEALSDSEETFRKLFNANLDSMTLTGMSGVYINVDRIITSADRVLAQRPWAVVNRWSDEESS